MSLFNSPLNLLITPHVYSSLHPSCYNQIIYAKSSLNIVLNRREINESGLEKAFTNIDVDNKIFLIRLFTIYYVILILMRRSYLTIETLLG